MSQANLFSRSVVAVALYTAFAAVQAQTNIAEELKSLKDRVLQLESQLKATESNQSTASANQVDPAEFNRIRVKTEAIEDNLEAQGFNGLTINGYMDPTFISNQARRSHSVNFMNNFDARDGGNVYSYDNSYFGNLWLDIQKDLEGGAKWRFTMAPHKGASSGYNLGSIVHEASVSIPLDDLSTRLIAGQIPDWSGYEYIPSNLNKLITHNMLFDFTMPSFYQGVGMEISSGKWVSKFLIGNMNATRYDLASKNNVMTARVDYSKGEYAGFGAAVQGGRQAGESILLGEVDGYFMRGPLTLQGQFSMGRVANGALPGAGAAKWTGLSALAAYKLTPQLELIGRLDRINNRANGGGTLGAYNGDCPIGLVTLGTVCPDGVNGFGTSMTDASGTWERTGEGVNRTALSLGLNYQYMPNVTFKAELRFDQATGKVFYYEKDGSYRKNNRMIGLSTVVSF